MNTITRELVLSYSGEEELEHVVELVLRSNTLTRFQLACSQGLSTSLELLSLSRNKFTSFGTLSPLSCLIELNINFNAIGPTLIQPHEKPLAPFVRLKKLFLSNNSLESVAEFAQLFPVLEHCCLFRNKLFDLDDALSNLRALHQLTGLDLAGNPCTFNNEEYKHTTVLRLKKLNSLDDERIEQLDRQLAELYFANKRHTTTTTTTTGSAAGTAADAAPLSRPSTAPSGGRNKRLFRSDFLNNHPIMLEYVARGLIHDQGTADQAGGKENDGDDDDDGRSRAREGRARSMVATPQHR